MSSKGKAIADGKVKRKIDDDDKTGRRNKKPSRVLQIFEDSAREADDSDYDSLDELFGDDEDCDDFLEDIYDGNANVNAESQKSVPFCEEDWMRFDMPGMAKQDVKVWVEEKMLVVKAEKKIENGEEELWPAKAFGKYSFRIALPENTQYEKIKAQVRDGVLYIIVPKASVSSKIFNINVE